MLDSTIFEALREPITIESFYGAGGSESAAAPYLIACFGGGRDSVGGLIKLAQLGIRPDLILMSDTTSEKDSTYNFIPIMNAYLRSIDFPEITMVELGRKRDSGFEAHLFRLGVFASLSYGNHSCSVTWKIQSQDRYLKTHRSLIEAKRQGRRLVRAVFFEAGEEYRAVRSDKNAIGETIDKDGCKRGTAFALRDDSDYTTWYPLIELGVTFDDILDLIWRAGLPIPKKSSCYFCAGMTELEIYQLAQDEPHKFFRALVLERIVQRNKIVKHDRRVQGIKFGKKWSDYECADPYANRIEEIIELFQLDREFADGDKNKKSNGWMKKAARVELFRECFASVENLREFMNGELDVVYYTERVQAINRMDVGDNQIYLPY